MAVIASNLILGPADMYVAAFGTTEPANDAINTTPAASAGWRDAGGTLDGVTVTINQEYTELAVDQVTDVVERRLTKRDFTIGTNMAEATLDNLAVALNNSVPVTGAGGTHILEADQRGSGDCTTYQAVLLDGAAPDCKRRRIIGRKMLSTDNVEFAYKKDEQNVFSVLFSGHYVSPAIAPFRVQDEDPDE